MPRPAMAAHPLIRCCSSPRWPGNPPRARPPGTRAPRAGGAVSSLYILPSEYSTRLSFAPPARPGAQDREPQVGQGAHGAHPVERDTPDDPQVEEPIHLHEKQRRPDPGVLLLAPGPPVDGLRH